MQQFSLLVQHEEQLLLVQHMLMVVEIKQNQTGRSCTIGAVITNLAKLPWCLLALVELVLVKNVVDTVTRIFHSGDRLKKL